MDFAMPVVKLEKIVDFANELCLAKNFNDYPAAQNGLQFPNSGGVKKIACAVDAGLAEFKAAAEMGADFLIVHHGLYWDFPMPIVGARYEKISTLVRADIALFSMHLPLDAHKKIGNNAQIAEALGLKIVGTCCNYGGGDIGMIVEPPKGGRAAFAALAKKLFPQSFKAIEFGSDKPKRIVICSGSCGDVVPLMPEMGVDTLLCGELREHHFGVAQDLHLNLYPCGHYATETFGVKALAAELAKKFSLSYTFIPAENPL